MGQDTKTATTAKAADERTRSTDGAANAAAPAPVAKSQPPKVKGKQRDMGTALRSVYQRTVDEAVPDDLLDLLGKLG